MTDYEVKMMSRRQQKWIYDPCQKKHEPVTSIAISMIMIDDWCLWNFKVGCMWRWPNGTDF